MKRWKGCFQDNVWEALGKDILLWSSTVLMTSLLAIMVSCLQIVILTQIVLQVKNSMPRILHDVDYLDLCLFPPISNRCLAFVASMAGSCLFSIDISRLVWFSYPGLWLRDSKIRWILMFPTERDLEIWRSLVFPMPLICWRWNWYGAKSQS